MRDPPFLALLFYWYYSHAHSVHSLFAAASLTLHNPALAGKKYRATSDLVLFLYRQHSKSLTKFYYFFYVKHSFFCVFVLWIFPLQKLCFGLRVFESFFDHKDG